MKKIECRPVNGSHFHQRDADIIGPELFRLAGKSGATPEEVLEAARKRASPLHQYFEWDDRKAAEKYRVDQAAYMLRSIEIKLETKERGETAETWARAFHCVRPDPQKEEKTFIPITVAQSKPELLEQIIQRAESELIGWTRRYETYKTIGGFRKKFQPVIKAIEKSVAAGKARSASV
jgi:hypothetical protein